MYVGNGECVCDGDRCDCFNEETTGLPFGGTLCECDPSICYSQEEQEVRPRMLCVAWIPSRFHLCILASVYIDFVC